MKYLSFIICSVLMSAVSLSLEAQQAFNNYEKVLSERGEVYFRFDKPSDISISNLSKIISLDSRDDNEWIYAYANHKEFNEFLKLNIEYEILQAPGTLIVPEMRSKISLKDTNDWDYYPTYEAYLDIMQQFEINYPELCDVFSIGATVQGRELLIAKLSSNLTEKKPKFLYTSSIHGDEVTGYVLMLRLIEYLLKSYGSDDQVTNLMKGMEIWINPLANPDGTYFGGNNTVNGSKRYNANNVDLNRNYPDPEDGPHPDGNLWQQETLRFMALADSISFVMSANFHGGAEVFNYPWDTWSKLHADDVWWKFVGREWADTVHKFAPDNYFSGFDNGITNGYAWYTISGGRQDYMNYFHHCREVTVEISDIKVLPPNLLPEYWEYNYRSFLNYMKHGLYGISGTISDSESGLPVKAVVTVINHDKDNSYIVSDSLTGNYYRPIMEGEYTINFSAPKYLPKTIESIFVKNYQLTNLDVQLVYTGAGFNSSIYDDWFKMEPNPANDHFYLRYFGDANVECTIGIYDISGKIINDDHLFFNQHNTFVKFDIHDLKRGLYIVKITSDQYQLTKKLILR